MIHPLNASLLSTMMRLPDEIPVEIVRYAVTSEDDAINIQQLPSKIEPLLSPFDRVSKLREIAEDEVYRVNTYNLHLTPRPIVPINIGVSVFGRNIEGLRIPFDVVLEGGSFHDVKDLHDTIWNVSIVHSFNVLSHVFPKLRSLDIEVRSVDADSADDIEYCVDYLRHSSGCLHFEPYLRMERMLRMQMILLLVGGVKGRRGLTKHVTFLQNQQGQSSPRVGSRGHHTWNFALSPSLVAGQVLKPTAKQKTRLAMLLCELRGVPIQGVEVRGHADDRGKKDRTSLENILKKDRTVVRLGGGA